MLTFRICAFLAALMLLSELPATAVAGGVETFDVDGHFTLAPDKKRSELSGLDCLAAKEGKPRLCLLVDDEGLFAQFATLTKKKIKVGDTIDLLKADAVFGNAPGEKEGIPIPGCSRGGEPAQVDGEAVAHRGQDFFVVGSHGCSKKGEYWPETFLLSRISVNSKGKVSKVVNTYRLSEAMQVDKRLKKAFGKRLPPDGNGVSIEAMTVKNDDLVIGFRSPATGGALLLFVPIADLFSETASFDENNARVGSVRLPDDVGFRDIETLPDGSLLALTGPDGEAKPNKPYALRVVNGDFSLGALDIPVEATKNGSPEAIEVLPDKDGHQRVLVVLDGDKDGGPVVVPLQ